MDISVVVAARPNVPYDAELRTARIADRLGYDGLWIDADGYLTITDRLKDMFTVGGFNVYPAEVEQVLALHDGVAEAAVVGVADRRLGEVPKAYVVARPGAAPAAADLVAFCRERLAGFKVPRTVEFLPELPRNAGGKVLKRELRGDRPAGTPTAPGHPSRGRR